MTRKEFYNEILKLAPSEYDASKCDFQKHLDGLFNRYIELLDELDNVERREKKWGSWDKNKRTINNLIDVIKGVIKLYYEGRHSKAFEYLKNYIYNENVTLDYKFGYGENFYRMRTFDEGEIHDCEGMFHIPFDKRTIVKTQRYSAPGYPCLYLGTSAYVCWEEMLRPNLDKCYVSRFHVNDVIFVYDLSLPSNDKWNNIDDFHKDLFRFPLVIASMVKVAKPKDPFKPEYIIPQLLMEMVIEDRQNEKNTYKELLMGIAYTSVHKSKDFDFDSNKTVNFAIPAFPPFDGNYSKELCKMFQLTEPTCDELERIKCPYQTIERDEKMSDLEYNYRISTFGQLEARLKDETKFPLDRIKSE